MCSSDLKSIADKEGAKADLEAELEKNSSEKKSKANEAMATAETLKDLHLECDWLTANFDARKEARAGEVESLQLALNRIAGARAKRLAGACKAAAADASAGALPLHVPPGSRPLWEVGAVEGVPSVPFPERNG